ncbi:hypothetical protein ACS3SW_02495 [Roseobacteraceae bacterium S113]
MKPLFAYAATALLFLCANTPPVDAQSQTRTQIGTSEFDGKSIILFDDGFWRYDDAGGVVCTDMGRTLTQVCSLPSEWSVFPFAKPNAKPILPPFLLSADGYFAEVSSMGAPGYKVHKGYKDIARFLLARLSRHSGRDLQTLNFESSVIDGRQWLTTSVITARGPEVISFTEMGDMVIIGVTIDANSSLILNWHKKKHSEFLAKIEFQQ